MTAPLCRFNLKIALKSDVDYGGNVFFNHSCFLITDAVANLDLVCKKKRKILIPSHQFIFYAYQLCIVIIIQDS